jgi:hypothetical protein
MLAAHAVAGRVARYAGTHIKVLTAPPAPRAPPAEDAAEKGDSHGAAPIP